MSVTWRTAPHVACMRCWHTANHHDHYTSSTACASCACPRFTGRPAWLLHLITRRWWT